MLKLKGKVKNLVKYLGVIILASSFLLTQVSCKKKQEGEKNIKIGVILPLTGNAAYFGVHERNGLNLALEEEKNRLGKRKIKVTLMFEDSKNDVKTAISALNKLITVNKTHFIISLFPVSIALNSITSQHPNILHIAGTMAPGITKPENTIRIWFSQEDEGKKIAEFCLRKKVKKVFILYDPIKAQEREVKEYIIPPLKQQNVKVSSDVLPFGIKDAKSILLKVKEFDPDLLVLIVFPNQIKVVFKAIREIRLNTPILGNIAFAYPSDAPIEWLEGVMFVTPSVFVEKIPAKDSFVVKYRNKYHSYPISTALLGYVQMKILSEAFLNGGVKPDDVKKYILSKKKFNTIVGQIEFSDDGNCRVPVTYGVIRNGKRVPLEF